MANPKGMIEILSKMLCDIIQVTIFLKHFILLLKLLIMISCLNNNQSAKYDLIDELPSPMRRKIKIYSEKLPQDFFPKVPVLEMEKTPKR